MQSKELREKKMNKNEYGLRKMWDSIMHGNLTMKGVVVPQERRDSQG